MYVCALLVSQALHSLRGDDLLTDKSGQGRNGTAHTYTEARTDHGPAVLRVLRVLSMLSDAVLVRKV